MRRDAHQWARLLYRTCSVVVVLIGMAHTATAFIGAHVLTQGSMWFAGSGLYMVTSGILGLLDAGASPLPAPVTTVVRGNHVVILAFALVTGALGRPTATQWALVTTAFGGMAVLPHARRRGSGAHDPDSRGDPAQARPAGDPREELP